MCSSRRVNGPIFPEDSVQSGDATDSKFFRLEPSEFTNGCFIARLSRQVRELRGGGEMWQLSEKNVEDKVVFGD